MNDKAGIWIDHKKAVIVSLSGGRVTTKTLESGVGVHPHFSGQQDGGGEKKYEERRGQDLDRYCACCTHCVEIETTTDSLSPSLWQR